MNLLPEQRSARRAFVLALTLLLGGCMVGPDYVRPTAPVAVQYKEADGWKVAQPADDAPRGAWWEAYRDPVLNGLVAQVEVNNQTIAAAAARVREAEAATQAARAVLFPVVNVGGTAARSSNASGSANVNGNSGSTRNAYGVALGASWEPDLWGGIRRSIESASGTAQATEADLAAARLSVQASVATNYFLLRVQDAQIALLRDTVTAYEKSVQLTQNQYAAGVVARGDVLQAQAQWKLAQAQIYDAQLARAQLEHAVAVLVGKPPSELSIAPATTLAAIYPEMPPGVPSALLERRPDIAAAERRAAAANAQIGVAQAAFFPSITLSANGGLQSSVIGSLLSLPNRYWSLGASLAQTIFDAGLRSAQKEQAIATYDATVATYRATVLTGFQEVEDNLAALNLLAQEAEVQQAAVDAARQSATIAMNQYRAGTANYIAVVVLQASALNSERTALQITGRRLTASVELVRALGGGWSAATLAKAD
jgi:NodT family efflux transporter outer membrane factor (OMF) lipoprotein